MATRGSMVRRLAAVVMFVVVGSIGTIAPSPQIASATLTGLPAGFVDETVVGNLGFPTGVAFSPDGRMLIALKSGLVRLYQGGALLPSPFIDIRGLVHDNHDRGLLGIAVHPGFPQQPYVYLLYTHDPAGVYPDTIDPAATGTTSTPARVAQVLRVEADAATGYTTAVAGSGVVILGRNSTRANIGSENHGRNTAVASCKVGKNPAGASVPDCIASDENSHTIGTLAFGLDGSLFVSSGDGSNYGGVDPRALRALDVDDLNGKILRIDPLTGDGLADNPFFDPADPTRNRSKVWSLGLRNPFRLTIHPTTGEPHVGDVGWSTWEEINAGKGANFGWPCYEGGAVSGNESGVTTSRVMGSYGSNAATKPRCDALFAQGLGAVKAPIFTYNHSTDGTGTSGGASANGGAFYTGSTWPAQYRGAQFIADYNRKWIRYLTFDGQGRATVNNFAMASAGPVQVISGPDQNLYWLRYQSTGGEVRRIRYTGAGNTPPTAIVEAIPTIGMAPLTVRFDSNRSFDPDAQSMTHAWDFGDGTTSTQPNPTHVYSSPGVFDAVLTLREATAPFAATTSTTRITVGTDPPLAEIDLAASTYAVGDVITADGRATAGGIALPAEQLSWELRHRHNQHVHYSVPPSVPSGLVNRTSWTVDDHGDSTSYQLCLTATVEDLTDTRCVDLSPRTTDYTLATEPVGLALNYEDEGLALTGPAIIRPIVGSEQTVSVDQIQQSRTFSRWSDGVTSRSRTFVVGTSPATYTAIFENRPPTAVVGHSALTGTAPHSVTLGGSGSSDPEGDALQYRWEAGTSADPDAIGTASAADASFTFPAPGQYRIALTVTDQLGAQDTRVVDIDVVEPDPPLSVEAQVQPTTGPAPLTVDATASTAGGGSGVSYTWTARLGATELTATGPQASFVLPTAGTWSIDVTASRAGSPDASDSVAVVVTSPPPPNTPPVARGTATPATGRAPLTVQLDGSTSSDADGDPLSYEWRLGGAVVATTAAFQRTFDTAGARTFTLTVSDGLASDSVDIGVDVGANRPPVAALSVAPASGPAPLSVDASAAGSTDPDGQPLTYRWLVDGVVVNGAATSALSRVFTTPGVHQITVVVTDPGGLEGQATATTQVQALPPPWVTTTVGSATGSSASSGGTFTMTNAGADIWGTADAFQFVHHPWSGDVEVVARVASLVDTNAWAKAGIMLRESTAAGARHVSLFSTPRQGTALQHRAATGGASTTLAGSLTAKPPRWLKVVRRGDSFSGYESADGVQWTLVGTRAVPMAGNILVGLAATSHDAARTTTATFDNVAVRVPPPTSPPAGGSGLRGEYFNNANFTAPVLTRLDAKVDFSWGNGSPAATIGADTFSVRWTGTVVPRATERVTFTTRTDDGVRLWINGVLIIDRWVLQSPREWTGAIDLVAGQPATIRLEYYENTGGAVAQLSWSSPSQPKQIIPTDRLFPPP